MNIGGFQAICLGTRNYYRDGSTELKGVCHNFPLYDKTALNTVKPSWRFKDMVTKHQRKCKLKELYGKSKE